MPFKTSLSLAVIGAGPVGLSLALHAARALPRAHITLLDARPLEHPVGDDPRTLALSLGSIHTLERLGVWPAISAHAAPIQAVHVSQQQPTLWGHLREPTLQIHASDEGVSQLGAVASYGAIVAPLQAAWLAACASEPARLSSRFGARVSGVKPLPRGAEVDTGVVENFDLVVMAEGGVFADQTRKPLSHNYQQTAWVGTVELTGGVRGVAYERFTPQGPAALLPLRDGPQGVQRAALVWCVSSSEDPVQPLTDNQRMAVLNALFAPCTGRIRAISALKAFPLGLNAEPTLAQGCTVRIGNAAQTLHPVAGQGLNLGLRDAQTLVHCLAREPGLHRALRQMQWQRAPDRWSTIAGTDFLARCFTWSGPGLSSLRGFGLTALDKTRPIKSHLARQMMFGSQ